MIVPKLNIVYSYKGGVLKVYNKISKISEYRDSFRPLKLKFSIFIWFINFEWILEKSGSVVSGNLERLTFWFFFWYFNEKLLMPPMTEKTTEN